MEKHDLGPNGGLVFCMEMLRENLQWLIDEIDRICYAADEADAYTYVIIDCPGQVRLLSLSPSAQFFGPVILER